MSVSIVAPISLFISNAASVTLCFAIVMRWPNIVSIIDLEFGCLDLLLRSHLRSVIVSPLIHFDVPSFCCVIIHLACCPHLVPFLEQVLEPQQHCIQACHDQLTLGVFGIKDLCVIIIRVIIIKFIQQSDSFTRYTSGRLPDTHRPGLREMRHTVCYSAAAHRRSVRPIFQAAFLFSWLIQSSISSLFCK